MPAQELTEQNDERSPLLRRSGYRTPLPAGPLFALLFLMIAEPVMALSVMPYINSEFSLENEVFCRFFMQEK